MVKRSCVNKDRRLANSATLITFGHMLLVKGGKPGISFHTLGQQASQAVHIWQERPEKDRLSSSPSHILESTP